MADVQGRIQRCDNQEGIAHQELVDNFGFAIFTNNQGLFGTTVAYPGYAITATEGDYYYGKQYVFTKDDIENQWVTICLDPKPEDTHPPQTGDVTKIY